jgi:alpha-mannosidase
MKRNINQSFTGKSFLSRRKFLKNSAAGSAFLTLVPASRLLVIKEQNTQEWPPDAPDYKIHMIGHAHIDPVWLWPWTEGLSIVHSTFRSALDRMNETPGFKFTSSSAQFYQWVADNDPGMLAEIRKRVEEGRWNAAGGWWVEPDVNIPCGESFVRQGLYGQLTLQKLLGRRAKIAFNPDSFGHTGTLPQIFKGLGMQKYVFMRPMSNEKTLPADLFLWEGPDGTRITTYRIPVSYNDTGPVRNRIRQVIGQLKDQPVKEFMIFYGAGDHGGGATKENIRSIEELRSEKGAPAVLYSTPEIYFGEIDKKSLRLPVVRDELQHHSVGCYTAESEIKKGNRTAETALITAEKITASGNVIWGCQCPRDEFTAAWKRIMLMQFHDSLAGTSLPEHSVTAREAYGRAADIAGQAMYMAVQGLAWQVPADDPDYQYIFVFNPHPWEINGNIEYDLSMDQDKTTTAEDEKGNRILHQWAPGTTETGNRNRIVARVQVPAFGYRQIRIASKGNMLSGAAKIANNNILENEYLRVTFSDKGTIGILDKETGMEIFEGGATGARAVVIDDPSDTWSHDVRSFSDETGAFGNASIHIIESGPLRGNIRVRTTYGNSGLSIDWLLYAGSRNIEARITLNWYEHLKMLKFSFPVNVESPVPTCEIPFGTIIRNTDGHEEPCQRWVDLSGKHNGKDYGLTVVNDAKYGYSVSGNDLRLSAARSAVYAHHRPRVLDMDAEHIWQDQGIQTFRMLLVPHSGTWQKSNIIRITEQFSAPLPVIFQGIHGGRRPLSGSFIAIDAGNVVLSALKQSETDNDLIFRLYEAAGIPVTATLSLMFAGKEWKGNFRPYEIKTLRMNPKTGSIGEVNLLEE